MMTSHVDDFLIAGDTSPRWKKFIEELKNTYEWSPWKDTDFVHCGVRIRQLQDYSFILDREEFVTGIEEIIIDRRRSEKEDTPVTEHERTELRGLLGAVQWKAYNTGPELSAQLSILQSQTTTATVKTLKAANKLVRDMHHHKKQQIVIHAFPADSEIILTCWTDAAVANRPDLSSTGAYILGATTKNILEAGGDNVSLISWRSGKLPRQARSSLSAEVQALSEGDQELMYSRLQWAELNGAAGDFETGNFLEPVRSVPGFLVVDARSAYDAIHKGRSTAGAALGLKEKYTALELLALLESIENCHTGTRWVHSEAMLADGLTKQGGAAASSLRLFLDRHRWSIVYDPEGLSAKNRKKAGISRFEEYRHEEHQGTPEYFVFGSVERWWSRILEFRQTAEPTLCI